MFPGENIARGQWTSELGGHVLVSTLDPERVAYLSKMHRALILETTGAHIFFFSHKTHS